MKITICLAILALCLHLMFEMEASKFSSELQKICNSYSLGKLLTAMKFCILLVCRALVMRVVFEKGSKTKRRDKRSKVPSTTGV